MVERFDVILLDPWFCWGWLTNCSLQCAFCLCLPSLAWAKATYAAKTFTGEALLVQGGNAAHCRHLSRVVLATSASSPGLGFPMLGPQHCKLLIAQPHAATIFWLRLGTNTAASWRDLGTWRSTAPSMAKRSHCAVSKTFPPTSYSYFTARCHCVISWQSHARASTG
jgi:hypothetical protein